MSNKFLKYLPYFLFLIFLLFFFGMDYLGHNLVYLFLLIFGIALFIMTRYLYIYLLKGDSKPLLFKIIFGGFILVFVVPFLVLAGWFIRIGVIDYLRQKDIASIRFGYINKAGQTVIPFQYLEAGPFEHGYALVKKDTTSCWIDSLGNKAFNQHLHYTNKPVIREMYYHQDTGSGRFWTGDKTIEGPVSEGLYLTRYVYKVTYSQKGFGPTAYYRYGFQDTSGNMIIAPVFGNAFSFREGLAVAVDTLTFTLNKGLKTGYINHSGHYVIPPVYDYAGDFYEGKAAVSKVMRQ